MLFEWLINHTSKDIYLMVLIIKRERERERERERVCVCVPTSAGRQAGRGRHHQTTALSKVTNEQGTNAPAFHYCARV